MNIRLRVIRNFGYLMFGKTLADAAAFAVLVLVSRTFGQEGAGHYAFAIGLTGLAAVLTDSGLYMLGVKELSRVVGSSQDRTLLLCRRLLSLRYALAGLATAGLLMFLPFVPGGDDVRAIVALMGLFQILNAIIDGYGSVLVAREEMGTVAAIEVSMRVCIAVVVGVMIWSHAGLVATLSSFPLAAALHVAAAHAVTTKRMGHRLLRRRGWAFKQTVLEARPYGVAELLRYLSTRLDVVLLGFLVGAAATGVYNVAYRFLFLLAFLPYYATLSLFPSLSRIHEQSRAALPGLYGRATGFAILVGLPGATALWYVSEAIITLVFGAEFGASAVPLRWLAWLFLLNCIDNTMGTLLTSCDRQPERTRAQWIAVVVNAAGNVLLIPILGVEGAAIATLASVGLLVVLYARALHPIAGWPNVTRQTRYALTGTGAFLVVLELLAPLPPIVCIVVSMGVYAAVLAAIPGFRSNEIRPLLELVRSRHAESTEPPADERR